MKKPTKRLRYGVVRRSSPDRRTFRSVAYDSLLECCRAQQLAMEEQTGLTWEPHPEFTLGCPENTYTADFRVRTPNSPIIWTERRMLGGITGDSVRVPDGWVEEVKGPVRTGIGRIKKLWKAYGKVPLVILTRAGGTGLQTRWTRDIVIPDSPGRKEKR